MSTRRTATTDEDRKEIRRGAKSCAECRRRKIRCNFTSSAEQICQHCSSRGLICIPQLYRVAQKKRAVSSQDRLTRLEHQLASLTAAARASPSNDVLAEDGSSDNSDAQDATASRPTHLRLLFDNAVIVDESSQARRPQSSQTTFSKLRALIPSREDVKQIAGYASAWMVLYHAFFPASTLVRRPSDLYDEYDTFAASDADPIQVAGYLLSLAFTVLQLGVSQVDLRLQNIRNSAVFVKRVMKVVYVNALFNDDLAASYEGVELHIFYIRLLLVMGRVREMYLILRRAVALAEYLGLHRTLHKTSTSTMDDHNLTLLRVMCATDRMASMMFNLPAATVSYKLRPSEVLDASGHVSSQAYLLELSTIALKVQEIDEDLALGKPYNEIYEKVILADSDVRSLAAKTPSSWWQDSTSKFEAKHLAQSFHYYLTVRLHLHSAMRADLQDQYVYSRTTCDTACEKSATRVLWLLQALPRGFFMLRLLQMQVFTVTIVLMLSHHRQQQHALLSSQRVLLVTSIIEVLEVHAREKQGNPVFATEAATALRALQAWLETPESLAEESLTLRVPMLGKVRIGERHRQIASETAQSTHGADNGEIQAMQGMDDLTRSQPWLLELDMNTMYDDAYLTNGLEDLEQYWPGSDGWSSGVPT